MHAEVWIYWNSAFSNFEPPDPPPPVLCAYTITPIFTLRRDQRPADLADFIASTPSTMHTQTYGFQHTLSSQYGVSLPLEALLGVTSTYVPGTVQDVCDWAWMKFCEDL